MNWKSLCYRLATRGVAMACALYFLGGFANAQQTRIAKAIDNQQRVVLSGHIHPKARPKDDQGRVAPSLAMPYVTLVLKQSESQHADLSQLLVEQQTVGSANYHRWLTPEQYAERFGVSTDDLNKIVAWLEGQGLAIAAVARGRNWIAVNGEAARIESAFQTEIHEYISNGEKHFAAASEPSVPTVLAEVVGAIRGLSDFRMKAKRVLRNPAARASLDPKYTSGNGETYLTPNDLATIYDIAPLYATGIDGNGQSLVIAGQTRINLSDIQQFRSSYGLPVNNPKSILVAGAQDPGINSNDLDEADLDLEWSGAVARNAAILFVYSSDVVQSVQYAIDQDLAPVISQSYGSCELESPSSDAFAFQQMGQQANAQGMTWFAASGDNGGADCNDTQNPGLSVDLPGSVPEVTSVGGTEFAEGGVAQYWSPTNSSSGASALSYIPETSWNDSAIDGSPAASGGGASIYFSKPSWQTGPGVPNDNARNVPDIALSASADHDGYFVYTGGSLQVYGGTSVPAPTFAGIITLLNQYLVSTGAQSAAGVGNINPKLYSLVQTAPSAFHDITTGNNIVTVSCGRNSPTCSATAVGYSAGRGYDQVTGLGSVDVYRLITAWKGGTSGTPPTAASITLMSNLRTVAVTDSVFLIATVTGADGATPVGTVKFSVGGTSLGTAALVGSGGTATATLTVSGNQLPAGSGTITAAYSEGSSSSVTASVTVSVSGVSASNGTPVVFGVANGASFQHVYSPGMTLSVFGTELAPSIAAAGSVPLPISTAGVAATVNNVAAPLYYVSPGQLNIQIPYDTANGPATLRINNNGQIASYQFDIVSAAPGIFTNSSGAVVPNGSGNRGAIVSLYLTGAGTVTPQVATGAAPSAGTAVASLPKPAQNVAVTVGGAPAALEFVGIPVGLVGVTQINFYVPTSIADGTQPVVVTVGTQASAPAYLTVNN